MRRIISSVLTLTLVLIMGVGYASLPRDPEKFHEMIAWRFIKYLDLNEEQSAKFIPIFKDSNKKRNELNHKSSELVDKLADDIDNEAITTEELKRQLAEIKKINKELADERAMFLKKLENILNERQAIKLEIFEDKFKNDLFRSLRENNRRRRNDSEND